jgi:hypothetical protein
MGRTEVCVECLATWFSSIIHLAESSRSATRTSPFTDQDAFVNASFTPTATNTPPMQRFNHNVHVLR